MFKHKTSLNHLPIYCILFSFSATWAMENDEREFSNDDSAIFFSAENGEDIEYLEAEINNLKTENLKLKSEINKLINETIENNKLKTDSLEAKINKNNTEIAEIHKKLEHAQGTIRAIVTGIFIGGLATIAIGLYYLYDDK